MTIFESVIIGFVSVLICLNVVLLATAALVFVFDMTAGIRQRKVIPRGSTPGHPRLDLWAWMRCCNLAT